MREETTAKLRDGRRGRLIEGGDAAYDDARQKQHMSDFNRTTIDVTPRRGFLRRVASIASLDPAWCPARCTRSLRRRGRTAQTGREF